MWNTLKKVSTREPETHHARGQVRDAIEGANR